MCYVLIGLTHAHLRSGGVNYGWGQFINRMKIYMQLERGKQGINAEQLGLQDLANKNAKYSAEFEFQISDEEYLT